MAEKDRCSGPCGGNLGNSIVPTDAGGSPRRNGPLPTGNWEDSQEKLRKDILFFLGAVCFMVFVASIVWRFFVGTGKD